MKMENQFKQVAEAFNKIKKKFQRGEISQQEFIDQLKKLRIKDSEGRFWMIGVKSGSWYYFDGKDWVESKPPSFQEKKAICIYCGFENRLEAEACARCGESLGEKEIFCPKCGYRLDKPSQACPQCGRESAEWEIKKDKSLESGESDEKAGANFVFRSLSPLSFLVFWGILGLFIGIILGAFTGATRAFPGFVQRLPDFFLEMQGKLIGSLIFGALGGVLGFLVFALLGLLVAILINLISSFAGGVKIRLDQIRR
jgi:hypothetical protein